MISASRICISDEDLRLFVLYSALTGKKNYATLVRYVFGCSTSVARELSRVIQKLVWEKYRISVYRSPKVSREDIERMSVLFQGFHETISFRHMIRMCVLSGRYADREALVNVLLSYSSRVGLRYRRKDILRLLRSERFWSIPKPRTTPNVYRERRYTRLTLLRAYYLAGFRTRNLRYTLRGRRRYGIRQAVCEWFGMGLLELREKYENGWTFADFLNLLEEKIWKRLEKGVRELYQSGLVVPRNPNGTFAPGRLAFVHERLCRYVGKEELHHIFTLAKSEEEFLEKVRKVYISSWLDTYYA